MFSRDLIAKAEGVLALCELRADTLALAESITGGDLCSLLTAIPGAATIVRGGAVVYTPAAKVMLLGISPANIARWTTVSPEMSEALAHAVRARLGATIGIGVTGNAGPGAEGAYPVGAYHWYIAAGKRSVGRSGQVEGNRAGIRLQVLAEILDALMQFPAPDAGGRA